MLSTEHHTNSPILIYNLRRLCYSPSRSVMKVLEIPKSGKCGGTVWQCNRYCQYSYPAFIPSNPRTPAQVTVRGTFGAVSARWRTLTEEQRVIWCQVARTKWSKPRLRQKGRLTGILLDRKSTRLNSSHLGISYAVF